MKDINRPHKWVVIKLKKDDSDDILYRVFGSWYGGYAGGDSWKMNSGIVKVVVTEEVFMKQSYDKDEPDEEATAINIKFHGHSGSIYECCLHEGAYSVSGYSSGVLQNMMDKAKEVGGTIEMMPYETDWANLLETE